MNTWKPKRDEVVQSRRTRCLGLVTESEEGGVFIDWEDAGFVNEYIATARLLHLLRPYWLNPADKLLDRTVRLEVLSLTWTPQGVNVLTSQGEYLAEELVTCVFAPLQP